MPAKPRFIVVDASVAASAGKSEHPESRYCRDFLLVMNEADHHLVMSKAVNAEWNLFMGKFARTWLAAMVSRGRVRWIKTERNKPLRRQIGLSTKDRAAIQIMLDDTHLIEAALSSHSLVASKDNEARSAFAAASRNVAALRTVCWINPATEGESALEWLRDGAKRIKARCLRAHSFRLS